MPAPVVPRLTRRVAAALERDEWQRAPTTLPTARPWAVVSALIEFPSSAEGIRIVDVGAGGSDAVATLLEAGADAFAVDPRYRSLADLIRETTAYFQVQEAIGQLPQASEPSARPIAAQRTAFGHFVSSFQSPAAQNHYVPAVATRLPFGSASVDLVYSFDCVTQYLDREPQLLLAAVREGLRILRRGGVLQLVPFQDDVFALGYHAERQQAQQHLLGWLETTSLAWSVDDLSQTGLTGSSRLSIRST